MFQIVKRLFGGQRSINNPAIPLNSESIINYLGNQGANRSGVNINKNTVFGFSPVWQAITMISGDLAKMRIHLFEDIDEDGIADVCDPVDDRPKDTGDSGNPDS